jgi:hypothetical protein
MAARDRGALRPLDKSIRLKMRAESKCIIYQVPSPFHKYGYGVMGGAFLSSQLPIFRPGSGRELYW